MKYNRCLVLGNEIITETVSDSFQSDTLGKYAINMVFSGAADYHISNRKITLFPESFIFLNSSTVYSKMVNSAFPVSSMRILLDPGFVSDFDYSIKNTDEKLLDSPEATEKTMPLFVESICSLQGNMRFNLLHLKRHMDNNSHDYLLMAEYLEHCLINYYDVYQSEITHRTASLNFSNHSTKSEILRRLCIARDYMISNYNKNICLEEIARVACLSVNHFLRTFKQAYHQSPHQFLTMVRLQQARYFLRNTNYPINEIVDIIGFGCPSSFIRLFRSCFKVTPGQYRY